jgi:hypothetical protein
VTPAQVLKGVLALYNYDEKRWLKGAFATDANKRAVSPTHDQAACWCLDGAIDCVVSNGTSDDPDDPRFDEGVKLQGSVRDLVYAEMEERGLIGVHAHQDASVIWDFNDHINVSFADVVELVEGAIKRTEKAS